MRLNRFLAAAGVGSRRHCDQLIADGRVTINGRVVTDFSTQPAEGDHVKVGGRLVRGERKLYIILHKPAGFVSTRADPNARDTIFDLLPPKFPRLFNIGRLDAQTEGLLILTNDGDLAQRLTHPSFEVPRTYRAAVRPVPVSERALRTLREGVDLDDGRTAPAKVRQLRPGVLELTIHEGRNHQVRRMCEAVGHRVRTLQRVRFGPLRLDDLPEGAHRRLKAAEVEGLRRTSPARAD